MCGPRTGTPRAVGGLGRPRALDRGACRGPSTAPPAQQEERSSPPRRNPRLAFRALSLTTSVTAAPARVSAGARARARAREGRGSGPRRAPAEARRSEPTSRRVASRRRKAVGLPAPSTQTRTSDPPLETSLRPAPRSPHPQRPTSKQGGCEVETYVLLPA